MFFKITFKKYLNLEQKNLNKLLNKQNIILFSLFMSYLQSICNKFIYQDKGTPGNTNSAESF